MLLTGGKLPGKENKFMAKKVKTIEPVKQKVLEELRPKKKVCAYCRVSTDSSKQQLPM